MFVVPALLGAVVLCVPPAADGQITNKTYQGPTTPPDNNWNLIAHWFPGGTLPGSTNNVIHDIGGQVRYDVANPNNQTIYSMEVEGGSGAELTVKEGLDLNILRYMERDLASGFYLLRLTESSDVTIGSGNVGDGLFDVDGLLEQGTAQAPTSLTVDGNIEYGAWVIDPDASLTVSGDIFRGQWAVFGGTVEADLIDASGDIVGNGGEWYAAGTVLPAGIISGVWDVDGGSIGSAGIPVESIHGGAWGLTNGAEVHFSDLLDANPWLGTEGGLWTLSAGSVAGSEDSEIREGDWLLVDSSVSIPVGLASKITEGEWLLFNSSVSIPDGSIIGGNWTVSGGSLRAHEIIGAGNLVITDDSCARADFWSPHSLYIEHAPVNQCEGDPNNVQLLFTTTDAEMVAVDNPLFGFGVVDGNRQYYVRMMGGDSGNWMLNARLLRMIQGGALEYCGNGNLWQNFGRVQFSSGAVIRRCSQDPDGRMELQTAELEIETDPLSMLADWDASDVLLRFGFAAPGGGVGPTGHFEMINTDWGPVWFCDVASYGETGPDTRIKPWAEIDFEHSTGLIDGFTNADHGNCPQGQCLFPDEATFVLGDVTVDIPQDFPPRTVYLNGLNIYVLGQVTIAQGSTVEGPGSITPIVMRHYGDFDGDGDIDMDDIQTIIDAIGDPTDNILCDADLDGDVDGDDFDRFTDNLYLYANCTECDNPMCSASSISAPTEEEVSEVVQWADQALGAEAQLVLSDSLEAAVDDDPGRADAPELLDLADALEDLAQP